jgi:hypothetical protein
VLSTCLCCRRVLGCSRLGIERHGIERHGIERHERGSDMEIGRLGGEDEPKVAEARPYGEGEVA